MRRSRSGLAAYERRMIVVQTVDGHAIRGAAHVYDDCIVLAAAELLDEERPLPLGGEVVVLRQNVSFFQTVPASVLQ